MNFHCRRSILLFILLSVSSQLCFAQLPMINVYKHILPTSLFIHYEETLLDDPQLESNVQNTLWYELGKNHLAREHYEKALNYFQMAALHPISEDISTDISKKVIRLKEVIFGEHLSRAIYFLENDNPIQTIKILNPYLDRHSYKVYLILGKAYAMNNDPHKALIFFKLALHYGQDESDRNEASRQMVKMQQWLHPHKSPKKIVKVYQNKPWNTLFKKGKYFYNHDRPDEAMPYFHKAYLISKNNNEKKACLFYILESANWTQDFKEAIHAYQLFLSIPHARQEENIFKTSHAKTLINMDYPREAITTLLQTTPISSADGVLTLADAFLNAGRPDQAKKLLQQTNSKKLLEAIPANSYLKNKEQDIENRRIEAVSKAMLNTDFSRIQDSTQFIINRETGEANYRTFGDNTNTSVMLSKSQYYNPTHYVNSEILFIKQDVFNILDKLNVSAGIVPTQVRYYNTDYLPAWNPLLWLASAIYKHNDYLSISTFNNAVLVETIPALQNNILMYNSEGSIQLHPVQRAYLNLTFLNSRFSDNNQRLGGSFNLLYQLSSQYGVFTKLRLRKFQNSYYDNPNYFSPQSIQGGDLFLILRKRLSMTTYLYAEGSVGLQQLNINPTEDLSYQTVYTGQVNLAQRITKYTLLTISYSYVQNVFNNLVGPYSQQYFGANFKIFID